MTPERVMELARKACPRHIAGFAYRIESPCVCSEIAAAIREAVSEKERSINAARGRLQNLLAASDSLRATLQSKLAEKDAKIKLIESEKETTERAAQALMVQLSEKDATITDLKRNQHIYLCDVIKEKDAKIKELETEHAKCCQEATDALNKYAALIAQLRKITGKCRAIVRCTEHNGFCEMLCDKDRPCDEHDNREGE